MQGALLALEPRTGSVRAMVGGFDFERSKFNRATQAWRQVGSAFKPFVYAAAIEKAGYTPATLIVDAPVSFPDNNTVWTPHNFDYKFEGPIPMRRALEDSRNVPAVKTLEVVGVKTAIDYAHKLGLTGDLPPYLPLALGAGEATLVEMTSAYSAFGNEGLRMKPFYITRITDRDGNVIEEARPAARDAVRADTAYLMSSLLKGRGEQGHGGARPLAQAAHRGQDGDHQRFHRCLVHRLRARPGRRGLGRIRRQAQIPRSPRGRVARGPAHVDGLLGPRHEGQARPGLPHPRQHRVPARRHGRASVRAGGDGHAHGSLHRGDRASRG